MSSEPWTCSPGWSLLSFALAALALWNVAQEQRGYGQQLWFLDPQGVSERVDSNAGRAPASSNIGFQSSNSNNDPKPNLDSHPTESSVSPPTNPNPGTDSSSNTNLQANTNTNANANTNTDTKIKPNTNANTNINTNTNSDPDPDANANTDPNTNTNTNSNPDADTNTHNTNSDAKANTNSNTEASSPVSVAPANAVASSQQDVTPNPTNETNTRTPFVKPHFHFMHMGAKKWNFVKQAVIESVFHHHPDAKLTLHLFRTDELDHFKEMFAPLNQRGFDMEVEIYSILNDCLMQVSATPSLMAAVGEKVMQDFLTKLPEYNHSKLWFANQANLARYCVLHFQGGIYIDTDVLLVKPWPAAWTNTVGLQFEANKSRPVRAGVIKGRMANNAVLQFQPGNPFIAQCIVEFLQTFHPNIWGYNGPRLVTKLIDNPRINNTILIVPSVTFAPVDWFNVQRLFWALPVDHPDVVAMAQRIAANSTAVHFYFNMGGPRRGNNLGTKLATLNCFTCGLKYKGPEQRRMLGTQSGWTGMRDEVVIDGR